MGELELGVGVAVTVTVGVTDGVTEGVGLDDCDNSTVILEIS